jgi:hypothetical protein
VLGLGLRPTLGLLEMTSKGTYGMGLVCLGREAISGSTVRRVRAPGALADDSNEAVEDARDPEVRARHRRLLASWQRALPSLAPGMAGGGGGRVLDVLQARESRMVLITDAAVALLRIRIVAFRSSYRLAWSVPLAGIQTVRGDSDRLHASIDHLRRYDTHCLGVWNVPMRKRIQCATRDILERLIVKINYHIRNLNAQPPPEGALALLHGPFQTAELDIFR